MIEMPHSLIQEWQAGTKRVRGTGSVQGLILSGDAIFFSPFYWLKIVYSSTQYLLKKKYNVKNYLRPFQFYINFRRKKQNTENTNSLSNYSFRKMALFLSWLLWWHSSQRRRQNRAKIYNPIWKLKKNKHW